jgi:branched-chain amino acid transport system substrate-binding protein
LKKKSIRRAGAALAMVLVLAACGSDDDATSSSTTARGSAGTTEGAVGNDTDTSTIPEATGPADQSLDPVKIGMINMDEGTPSYPDVSIGVDAAAELINAELGGIQGRPVEIVHCNVGVDQASNQKCAQQFANDDDISVVINGYVFASGFIFPILDAAELPVLLQTPLTSPDFMATNAYGYAGGNAGGTVGTAAFAAKFLDAKKITVLGADNDALRSAVKAIEGLPSIEGVEVSTTYIPDTAADVTADIQASGAADADAVLALINAPQCVQVAQTLKDLDVSAPVISTTTCAVPSTLAQSPELFEGWHVVGSGLPPLLSEGASAELDYFRETFPEYGSKDKTESFLALGGFGAMLAAWDIGNDLPEALTRTDWSTGLKGFTGPYFGGQDEFSCPGPHYPAVCSNDVRAYVLDDQGVMTQVQDFFDPLS